MKKLGRVRSALGAVFGDLMAMQPARVDFYRCCGSLSRCTAVGLCSNGTPSY